MQYVLILVIVFVASDIIVRFAIKRFQENKRKKNRSDVLNQSLTMDFSLESKWNRVMAAIPKRDGPTKGQSCSRGRFCMPQLLNGADRLKQPMIRKNGKLVPVNWDEAISYAAEKLKGFKSDEIGIITSPFLMM